MAFFKLPKPDAAKSLATPYTLAQSTLLGVIAISIQICSSSK